MGVRKKGHGRGWINRFCICAREMFPPAGTETGTIRDEGLNVKGRVSCISAVVDRVLSFPSIVEGWI